MSGYKIAQKRLALRNQQNGNFSQLKFPTVDKRMSERDSVKGLIKVRSGKLPQIKVEILL